MGYMSSTGVGTLVPSKENMNGVGVLIPLKNGTKVPPPEKYANGAGVLTPLTYYHADGTKVPASIFFKKNKLKKIGNSDFLCRQLTKLEKDFIEHIEYNMKKLKGKT